MAERRPQLRRLVIPAGKARQGEIILRTPLRRGIFIAGLAGAVLVGVLLTIWSYL